MLEIQKVSKKLGERVILDGIDLEVRSGEIIFVLGRSGVGKSVLLRTIVGLMVQDSGDILIDGERTVPEDEIQMAQVRRNCGLVFQVPTLLDSLNVLENLLFAFGEGNKASVLESLAWMNLSPEVLERFPNQLSYGTQKKISFLRTLLLKPKYLLFDEPTTGLDPISAESTNRLIQNGASLSGAGVVVVSHDVKSATRLAHRIYVLDKGRFVFVGTPKEFEKSTVPLVRAFIENTVTL